MTVKNVVMWETQLSIVDWVYSKTEILLEILKTPNQTREESFVFSEVERLCKKQTFSVSQFHRIGNYFVGLWFANGRNSCI